MSEQNLSMGTQGMVVQPGEGAVSSFTPGRSITIKLPRDATGDSIMLFEETVPPGTKSTLHSHHDSDGGPKAPAVPHYATIALAGGRASGSASQFRCGSCSISE